MLFALLLAALVVIIRAVSPGMPEAGDGVLHFLHAQYFWRHADAALSLWGKPLFSLLAWPFTYLGPIGTCVLGALCGLGATWAGLRIVGPQLGPWRWLVPSLVLIVPVQAHVMVAGMTECLFGVLSVLVVLFLHERHVRVAVGVCSALPFVRPEYAPFMLCVVVYVVLIGRWRALPWLGVGMVIYMLLTWLVWNDPLRYFDHHTYIGNDIYGKGELLYFVEHAEEVYGAPFLVCLGLSMVAYGLLFARDRAQCRAHLLLLLVTMVPATGIFLMHSIAWWYGGLASFGLLRVLATTVPLLAVAMVYGLAHAWRIIAPRKPWSERLPVVASIAYAPMAAGAVVHWVQLPVPLDPVQRSIVRSAAYVSGMLTQQSRVHYWDVLIGHIIGSDPWDPEHSPRVLGANGIPNDYPVDTNDIVVWDGHFASHEGRVPLDSLLLDPRLRVMAEFVPSEEIIMFRKDPFRIVVLQGGSERRWTETDTLVRGVNTTQGILLSGEPPGAGSLGASVLRPMEYPLTFIGIPPRKDLAWQETITVRGTYHGEGIVHLVAKAPTEAGGERYLQKDIPSGPFEVSFPIRSDIRRSEHHLYFWTPGSQGGELLDLVVLRNSGMKQATSAPTGPYHP